GGADPPGRVRAAPWRPVPTDLVALSVEPCVTVFELPTDDVRVLWWCGHSLRQSSARELLPVTTAARPGGPAALLRRDPRALPGDGPPPGDLRPRLASV